MKFITWKELAKRRTTSISTEKRRVKDDPRHPKLVQVSPGRVAFVEAEIEVYDENMVTEMRIAERDGGCDAGTG